MIDHRSYTHNLSSCEIKAQKNSGLNGIRIHDLCGPLRYLPTAPSSQLRACHVVSL